MKIYDLTQDLFNGEQSAFSNVKNVIWTHDTHDATRSDQSGYSWETTGMILYDDVGTHVVSISHMDPDPAAPSIDRMDLENFFGTAVCLDVSFVEMGTPILEADLDRAESALIAAGTEINENDILLIYTSYCEKTHRPTRRDLVYSPLDADAVRWIVRKRVKSLGIDVPSIDINGDHTFPAHFAARQNGLIHMKNLIHMRPLVNKRFQFIGIPLKIVGGSGSPIRAVAVVEDEDCVRNSEGENDDLLVAIKHSEEK